MSIKESRIKHSTMTRIFWLFLASIVATSPCAHALVDDRLITIHSASDVADKRTQLIQFIWGEPELPATIMPTATLGVPTPVPGLGNLRRVDTLNVAMEAGQAGLAHHFVPNDSNGRMVLLHLGHMCTFNDNPEPLDIGHGMRRTINALLNEQYAVLAVYMPYFTPGNCGGVSHDAMFDLPVERGSPMKFFLEPVVASLNYLRAMHGSHDFPAYRDFSMIGLSGGGWTTVVYSALDPTISLSIPVAGAIPLYLRSGGSVGDLEQTLDAFYSIAGYPDLFVMGAHGTGRRQIQVLNRRDNCCFGQNQHSVAQTGMSYDQAMRQTERQIRATLANRLAATGDFRLEIDESAPAHLISWSAIANILLTELNGARKHVGATSTQNALVRGTTGDMWHYNRNLGWSGTGLNLSGAPAIVEGPGDQVQAVYRDHSNRLKYAWRDNGTWYSITSNDILDSDPVAVQRDNGAIDILAIDREYRILHRRVSHGSFTAATIVNPTVKVWGQASLVAAPGADSELHVLFKDFDRRLHHAHSATPAGPWQSRLLGGFINGMPSAGMWPDGSMSVLVRGQSGQLWEAFTADRQAWEWWPLADLIGEIDLYGALDLKMLGDTAVAYLRSGNQNLLRLRYSNGWQLSNLGGILRSTPATTPEGAFMRGLNSGLWLYDGAGWSGHGGVFE